MNTHSKINRDQKDHSVSAAGSQPSSRSKPAVQMNDNRVLAVAQRKAREAIDSYVAQPNQGGSSSTLQMKGSVSINDDAGLEKEADLMGVKAMQFKQMDDLPMSLQRTQQLIHPASRDLIQRNPIDSVKEAGHRTKSGVGPLGVATGVLATGLLMSNPVGWGVMASMAGGLAVSALTGYAFGSSSPAPLDIRNRFVDGQVAMDYHYHVTFKGDKATISVDFYFDAAGLSPDARQRYIQMVQQRVTQIFGNRITIEHAHRSYLVENVIVHSHFTDEQARISLDGHKPRVMRLDPQHGRPNAMHFRPAEDQEGYSGAHEVGHHLGLLDEYSEPAVSPYRAVHHDQGIMTGHYVDLRQNPYLPPPALMDRNVTQIKREIERALADRERANRPRQQRSILPL